MQKPKAGLRIFVVNCAVCVALAIVISSRFGDGLLLAARFAGRQPLFQLTVGMALAPAVAVPFVAAIQSLPFLTRVRAQLVELAPRVDFSGLKPFWMAMFAGFGEETLFRGAVQPLLGIWWSSCILVMLHAGTCQFRTMNW